MTKGKEKKEGERKLYTNYEFKDLVGKEVVVLLRTGVIICGLLVEEGKYHLVMANAKVIGKRYEANIMKIVINKGYMALVHTKPLSLKRIKEEFFEDEPLYPKNLERI